MVYRRWTLLIPLIMILVGLLVMFYAGPIIPALGLLGGGLALVGILTLGALLAGVLGLEFASRRLSEEVRTRPLLSEEVKREEVKEENQGEENDEGSETVG